MSRIAIFFRVVIRLGAVHSFIVARLISASNRFDLVRRYHSCLLGLGIRFWRPRATGDLLQHEQSVC